MRSFSKRVWFPIDRDAQRKLLQTTSFVILMLAIGLIVLVIFWMLVPYEVSDVEEPIVIRNKNHEISVGEAILLTIEVTKPNDFAPSSTVFITCNDGNLVTLDSLASRNLPTGTFTVENDRYILPNKVLTGATCQFNFRNVYQVNPIRTITKEWESEEFLVVERGGEIGR